MIHYLYIIAGQYGLRIIGSAPNVEARLRGLQEDVGIPLTIEWMKPMDAEKAARIVSKAHELLEPYWEDYWYRTSLDEVRAAIRLAQAPETPVEDDYQPGIVNHPR